MWSCLLLKGFEFLVQSDCEKVMFFITIGSKWLNPAICGGRSSPQAIQSFANLKQFCCSEISFGHLIGQDVAVHWRQADFISQYITKKSLLLPDWSLKMRACGRLSGNESSERDYENATGEDSIEGKAVLAVLSRYGIKYLFILTVFHFSISLLAFLFCD